MTVTGSLTLNQLSDAELVEGLGAGAIDPATFGAEVARRELAAQRSATARAAARKRHAEWEAAAYAQYEAASAYCNGDHNMLSDAGKRAKRDAWPMCWQGSEETARGLASDELITFWDYVSPRVPGPAEYAASKRHAAAEQELRARDSIAPVPEPRAPRPAPRPTVPAMSQPQIDRFAAALSANANRAASVPATPRPGCIARYTARLEALTDQITRQAARLEASLARINGGNQR